MKNSIPEPKQTLEEVEDKITELKKQSSGIHPNRAASFREHGLRNYATPSSKPTFALQGYQKKTKGAENSPNVGKANTQIQETQATLKCQNLKTRRES